MNKLAFRCFKSMLVIMTIIFLSTAILVPAVSAQNFATVNCNDPQDTPAEFNSLQQALDNYYWDPYALDITVSGTCHERIFIGDGTYARNSIYIHPPEGQRAAIVGTGTGAGFMIGGAHGIYIERLDISGFKNGFTIYDASEVDFFDVTIENNTNFGVSVGGNSIIYFASSRIRNNAVTGLDVSSQGANTVYFRGGLDTPDPGVIEGNGLWGINAGSLAAVWLDGLNIVRNNGGSAATTPHGGIHATRNSSVVIRSSTPGGTEITGNTGPGILAEVNSSVASSGANVHANNGEGVLLRTHSVLELLGTNTFTGNSSADIGCDAWSLMTGTFTGLDLKSVCKNIDIPIRK